MTVHESAESINHAEKILKYWSVIETLNPQSAPKNNAADETVRMYVVKCDDDLLPWHALHKHQTVAVTERTKWTYTLCNLKTYINSTCQHFVNNLLIIFVVFLIIFVAF